MLTDKIIQQKKGAPPIKGLKVLIKHAFLRALRVILRVLRDLIAPVAAMRPLVSVVFCV